MIESFTDVIKGQSYKGSSKYQTFNMTTDGGKSWNSQRNQVFYEATFSLSDDLYEHSRMTYSIVHLLCNLGGFGVVVYVLGWFISSSINSRILHSTLLHSIFYFKKPKISEGADNARVNLNDVELVNLSFFEKLGWKPLTVKKDAKAMIRQQRIVDAEAKLEKEMNLVSICQNLQKVKAAIAVVVGKDEKLVQEINSLYIQNSTISFE